MIYGVSLPQERQVPSSIERLQHTELPAALSQEQHQHYYSTGTAEHARQ